MRNVSELLDNNGSACLISSLKPLSMELLFIVLQVNVPLKEQSQQASVQAPDVMEKKPKSRMGMFRCLACAGTCTS